jgi:CRISPR-associated protein (TIGR03986 family)
MVYHFLNPYNFVRTIQKARENLHILGNCPPPPHDRYVGLTGRIVCEVEAVTSLFISDSHAVKEDGRKHRTYRFFQYDGQPALPASSLRGMVRSVYEALTNSCFSIFQKDSLLNGDQEIRYPLEYRATQAQDMIPARVIDIREDGRACLEKLDCNINIPVKINESYPTIIKAGSVKKAYPPRVKLNNGSLFNASASKLPPDVYDGMRVAALVAKQPQLHKSKLFRAFEITNVRPVNEDGTFELNSDEGYVQIFGWLHITGPNIENKHDERLFFRWDDKKPDSPKQEEISSEYLYDCDPSVVEEYNHHLSAYWNRLKDTVEELNKKQKRWPKSNADMPQPSMFVEKNRTLQVGDLVYMQYDYNTKNQAVRLRPVAIPRLPYKHCREDFLPEHLKKRCELYDALCPACRLFGWVRENAGDANVDQLTACAGRLRFSHGTVKGNPIVEEKEIGLAILSTPKPTTTSFYLLDSKGKPNINVTYNNDDAQLRGRKMYRHHGVANSNEYERKDKDKQNRTIAGVLKPTTKFSFTIDSVLYFMP